MRIHIKHWFTPGTSDSEDPDVSPGAQIRVLAVARPRREPYTAEHVTRPTTRFPANLFLELHDCLYLDTGPQRERRHADGTAGVPAGVAEHIDEQLRRAVDDQVLLHECRVAVDEAG